jgi:hypothetical protein
MSMTAIITMLAASKATLAYLYWYGQTYGDGSTGVVGGAEDTTGPTAVPVPDATYPPTMAADIAAFKARAVPEVGDKAAESILATCLLRATRGQCLEMPIFVSGSLPNVEPATAHVRTAIFDEGKPMLLRYLAAPDRFGRWYRSDPACLPPEAGKDCDEYPFRSTREGGPGPPPASLAKVPASANRSQGGSLGAFYRRCGLRATGKAFLVVPAPPLVPIPSAGIC